MRIFNWVPISRGEMRGFFSIEFVKWGVIVHKCALYERGSSRWVLGPQSRWSDKDGGVTCTALIEFSNRGDADLFSDAAVDALDKYLAGRVGSSAAA